MADAQMRTARIVSVVAATTIALACGTNYAYSAWGPAFAQRMVLNSKQQNLIGLFGNLGMYGTGIPTGLMVDRKGPRTGAVFGCVVIAVGYFAIYQAYLAGPGAMPIWLVCIFTLLTGTGSAAAFAGSIKTSAVNWPMHRGTATAFPLSAFGLSAFFFSAVSNLALPGDTAGFLLFLSIGTFIMIASSTFFIRILPQTSEYAAVPTSEMESRPTWKTQPETAIELGTTDLYEKELPDVVEKDPELTKLGSADAMQAANLDANDNRPDGRIAAAQNSLHADVRGWKLLRHIEFYQQFLLLGSLTGIGLMTINNIGNDAQALWSHYESGTTLETIRTRSAIYVSLISVGSFAGRLLSGIGSDIVVKHNMSRLWCLVISSSLFCFCQFYASVLSDPNYLFLLSALTGVAYGFLFGCFPSIVADTFGNNGLAQNWGTMTIAPILFGNVFNMIYGSIYDAHSDVRGSGHRECKEGLNCYRSAYLVTLIASIGGIAGSLWSIRHGAITAARKRKAAIALNEGHIA